MTVTGGEGMSRAKKQATLQQQGGKGNTKRAPGKMGGNGNSGGKGRKPLGGTSHRGTYC